jgi:pyridoxal phosphate enzyme (YggS family)
MQVDTRQVPINDEVTRTIEANVRAIQDRIARAAERAGRKPEDITLVAVTKTFGPDKIIAAARAGLRHIGENRVEEADEKIPVVFARLREEPTVQWHMIGHIQHRKAKRVTQLFDMVQSVDSVRLAEALNRATLKPLPVLLEINIAREPQKFGFLAEPTVEFDKQVEAILGLRNLRVRGLMTVGPQTERPEASAIYFRQLRELRDHLRSQFPQTDWSELSMGMTADFETAIEEGATIVRVGRAIFGERN